MKKILCVLALIVLAGCASPMAPQECDGEAESCHYQPGPNGVAYQPGPNGG